jgi:flagellar basal body-associated protein FliL
MGEGASGWLWLFIDVGLVGLLAGGMIYGTVMWRKWQQHPVKTEERDRATREAYKG